MPRHAMIWDETGSIVAIGPDLEAPDGHSLVEIPEGVEEWRFSTDDDGEVVIAYEGQNQEEALASLLADQQAKLAEEEAAVIASRFDG